MMLKKVHSLCGIIPPYMLESISKAEYANAEGRAAARRTLALTTVLQTKRRIDGARISRVMAVKDGSIPHKNRRIYTCNNSESYPGTLVRSEGGDNNGDAAADECYESFGATFDFYQKIFERNSLDNTGMDLIGSVHYGKSYNNAFWNGSQMIFGDGDGIYFNRFTQALEVIAHELAHGVTSYTADLEYEGQSGALNESLSDVFGSMVKQHHLKQRAADADWLIGKGIFTNQVQGVAFRSMKAPGTAYNDPHLGKDPQPAHMKEFIHTTEDNGGVHKNCSIPNHAFYLLATALGGYSWEKAGRIWYAVLRQPELVKNADFVLFAKLTCEMALKMYGETEHNAALNAWKQVGVIK